MEPLFVAFETPFLQQSNLRPALLHLVPAQGHQAVPTCWMQMAKPALGENCSPSPCPAEQPCFGHWMPSKVPTMAVEEVTGRVAQKGSFSHPHPLYARGLPLVPSFSTNCHWRLPGKEQSLHLSLGFAPAFPFFPLSPEQTLALN